MTEILEGAAEEQVEALGEAQKMAVEAELKNEATLKSGAGWFYWIAGFSLVNSAIMFCGGDSGFVIGLGITILADAIGRELGTVGIVLAVVFDLIVAGGVVALGVWAGKRKKWAFIVGMILYGLDGLLLLAAQDFLSAGFHGFALYCIFGGYQALRRMHRGEIENIHITDHKEHTDMENTGSEQGQYSAGSSAVGSSGTMGLAIASLVLGILAVLLSVVVIGAIFGVIGLILGIVHVSTKKNGRAMGGFGIGLSALGMILSVFFPTALFVALRHMPEARQGTQVYAEWIGKAAPGLTLNDLEGRTITLSGLKGRRVVLDFFATWCPPCLAEIPHFVQMQADNSKDKVMIIGISDEGENILARFGKKYKINYPMVSASSGLPRPYSDVRDIPTTFFIDRKGIIQSVLIGGHSAATLREHALGADYQAPVEAEPAVRPPGGF